MLAMDVGQQRAGFLQESRAHRLVIEKGPRRSAAAHGAAEHQWLVRLKRNAARRQQRLDRMAALHLETRRDARRFGARPYRSILYTVAWPGDPLPDGLGAGAPPYVEVALL